MTGFGGTSGSVALGLAVDVGEGADAVAASVALGARAVAEWYAVAWAWWLLTRIAGTCCG